MYIYYVYRDYDAHPISFMEIIGIKYEFIYSNGNDDDHT